MHGNGFRLLVGDRRLADRAVARARFRCAAAGDIQGQGTMSTTAGRSRMAGILNDRRIVMVDASADLQVNCGFALRGRCISASPTQEANIHGPHVPAPRAIGLRNHGNDEDPTG